MGFGADIENIRDLVEGVNLANRIIKSASSLYYPDLFPTDPRHPAFLLWNDFQSLAVKLHYRFGYDFSLNVVGYQDGVVLPVVVNFSELDYATRSRSPEYFFHPFTASPLSHKYQSALLRDDIFAVDIQVPEGTPVKSMLGGAIVQRNLSSEVGGNDPKWANFANRLGVYNSGNNLSVDYIHLARVSREADEFGIYRTTHVIGEQILGRVGLTGWTEGPHLHFAFHRQHSSGQRSLPVKFSIPKK